MNVFLIDADNLSMPEWIDESFQKIETLVGEVSVRRAGLLHLRQKPTLMNRFQPVPSFAVPFIQGFLSSCSAAALKLDLPADELQAWKQLVDFDSPNHILRDPDFQYRAIQTVFVGTVP